MRVSFLKVPTRVTLFDLNQARTPQTLRGYLVAIAIAVIAAALIAIATFPQLRADLASMIDALFADARRNHVGLPVAIAVFVATAYVGAPQALLIGACVLAFGSVDGFWYSWLATIVSGAVTFHGGRAVRVADQNGEAAPSALHIQRLSKNGFLASFVMRFVPGPPFILVNMALAAARIRFWPYMAGLAIGVLPKTAIIAFAGGSLVHAFEGELGVTALLLAGIVACIICVLAVRRIAAA